MAEEELIRAGFAKAMSQHGYGFQYAVIKKINELRKDSDDFHWTPWVPEFPVVVQGYDTRIDFILRHRDRERYLACECKRANPATANWCFSKASVPSVSDLDRWVCLEEIRFPSEGEPMVALDRHHISEKVFHIAIETKTGRSGDCKGSSRGEIERACGQVCRGLNGLIEFMREHPELADGRGKLSFLPVVFTTAALWSSQEDLANANLSDGLIEVKNLLERADYLYLHYPQSPGLKHSLVTEKSKPNDLRYVAYDEFVRSITFVNPSGIQEFLSSHMWL